MLKWRADVEGHSSGKFERPCLLEPSAASPTAKADAVALINRMVSEGTADFGDADSLAKI
jgi:hypothetical protein